MLVIWEELGREMNGKLPLTLLVATEYLVMPFGLSNSLAVFQALVNDTLRDMLNRFIFVYLDNILIFSKTLPEHILHVHQVLSRLLKSQLYIKIEKCKFYVSQVSFLGHIISTADIQMDPVKVSTVTDWPHSASLKHIQQ